MTIRQATVSMLWSLPIMATSLMLSSCANPVARATHAPTALASAPQLAQIGYGAQADFVQCVPPQCPLRTPKTIGAAPAPEVPSAAAPEVSPSSLAVRPVEPAPEAPRTSIGSPVTAERMSWSVPFAFGSAQLGATAQAVMQRVIDALPGDSRVTIAGRTDDIDPGAVNDALAQARAEAVRDHLLRARPALAPDITVQAQGKCCFAAANDTAAGRARNRRVEVVAEPAASPP